MKLKSKILLIALVFGAYSCSPRGDKSVLMVDVNGSKMAVLSLNNLKSDRNENRELTFEEIENIFRQIQW